MWTVVEKWKTSRSRTLDTSVWAGVYCPRAQRHTASAAAGRSALRGVFLDATELSRQHEVFLMA